MTSSSKACCTPSCVLALVSGGGGRKGGESILSYLQGVFHFVRRSFGTREKI